MRSLKLPGTLSAFITHIKGSNHYRAFTSNSTNRQKIVIRPNKTNKQIRAYETRNPHARKNIHHRPVASSWRARARDRMAHALAIRRSGGTGRDECRHDLERPADHLHPGSALPKHR